MGVSRPPTTGRLLASALRQTRSYSAPADGAFPPNKVKYIPTSGTYPKGFQVGSAHAQVKASNTKFDDLALIASERPCAASAVFTQNAFKAAPVHVSKDVLERNHFKSIRGVIINSGCANAVTGQGGLNDARDMATRASNALIKKFTRSIDSPEPDPKKPIRSLVMSTGVIGQRLPIDRINDKIPELVESLGDTHDHWLRTARAICTTDTFPKLLSRQYTLPSYPGVTFSMAGMTKGAGMIHPNMATLLGVICTDAPVKPKAVRALLSRAVKTSFNRITIDGDTSTNDTVAFFANGCAVEKGTEPVGYVQPEERVSTSDGVLAAQNDDYKALQKELDAFMADLAKLVVRDGEGATKFVSIRVENARSEAVAETVAKTIAQSALVKTALYGKDANWGRILCAIGYAPGRNAIVPGQTSVSFVPTDGSEELKLLVDGEPQNVDEARAKTILEMEDLDILVKLSHGDGESPNTGRAVVYTCDFSHEYVTINGDYRT